MKRPHLFILRDETLPFEPFQLENFLFLGPFFGEARLVLVAGWLLKKVSARHDVGSCCELLFGACALDKDLLRPPQRLCRLLLVFFFPQFWAVGETLHSS